jgi:hypothetical protein
MSIYKTRDFYLSAFLVASSMPMLEFSRDGGVTVFHFSETPELQKLVTCFYADQAVVSPIRYGNALKNMKSLIRNTNTNGNHSVTTTGSFR